MITLTSLPRLRSILSRRFPALLVFSLLVFAPILHAAESASLPEGRYVLDRTSLRAFEEALARAASQIPAMQRQMALRRLRERLNPPADIAVAPSEAGWALRFGENQFPPLQPGAKPVSWTSKDGQQAQISLRWHEDRLEQSIASGDRARLNTLSFDPAEKVLLLKVHLHGSQLRQPVVFTLRYLPAA